MLSHSLQCVSWRGRPTQVLLAALLLAPLLAFSSPPRSAASPGMAVAGGTVTSAGGTALAGQAVDLYAWPSDAVQKALKPGQLVPTTLLATATTSSAGQYMLRVPVAKLKAAAVESGYANLEIVSAAGGFWFFPYQTGSLPAHPSAPVTVNLHSDVKTLCGKGPQGQTLIFTGLFKLKDLNPAWGVVGQGYIVPRGRKTAGDVVQFDYNRAGSHSQASTLGIGLSGYGIDAGYTSSGSNVSTATQEVDYPKEPRNTWFRTEFSVTQYRGMCVVNPFQTVPHKKQKGRCPRTWTNSNGGKDHVYKCIWAVKSTGWFGPSGSMVHPRRAPSTPGKFCGQVQAGISVKTSQEKAIQWSSGFEIGASAGIKGVNLKASFGSTAQTGYDTNDQMIFTFKHNGWICGTNHKPALAALLVMRGNKA